MVVFGSPTVKRTRDVSIIPKMDSGLPLNWADDWRDGKDGGRWRNTHRKIDRDKEKVRKMQKEIQIKAEGAKGKRERERKTYVDIIIQRRGKRNKRKGERR